METSGIRAKSRAAGKITVFLFVFFIAQNISAYTWKPVVVPAGGAIKDMVFSPVSQDLIYIRTDMGGAYRWDNANSIWIPLTDWIGDWNLYGIESIAPDPKNANVVYAAIGQSYAGLDGYIIASSDRGNTWAQYPIPVIIAGNDPGSNAGERLAVDPDNTSILYFGTRNEGLWKSTNYGVNWSRVASFPVTGDAGIGLSYVIFDPNSATGSGSTTIYVGVESLSSGNSNIYRSTNSGNTWAVIPGGPSGMDTPQASLGSDRNLWIVYGNHASNPTTGQIWKLNVDTLGWSNVTPPIGPAAGAGGYSGICVDAQNSQHAVVSTMVWWGGPDKCFQTVNGGTTWTIISNVQNSWNSGPYANYDINGAPWTRFCTTYNGGAWFMDSIKIDPFNSNHVIYPTGGGIWSTKNVLAASQPQGITWTFTDYGIEQTAVLFICPSYKGGVFFSCLGDVSGMRYTNLDAPAPDKYCNPHFSNTTCLDYAENNTNIVARVGNSGSTASDTGFSTDNGQTWTPGATAPPGYGTANQMRSCAVSADGSRVIVCPFNGYGSPAYTTNRGASWTTCNGLPSGSDLASDRVNASVFFATNGSNLYLSTDGGANFSVVNTFTGNGEFNRFSGNCAPRTVFGLTGEVWLATGNGLCRFTNNGATKTIISGVSSANTVGFGKAAPGQSHPAVYMTGTVGGVYGFYRCDDGAGISWVRLNDDTHRYGGGGWCGGDQAVYGRMYVGTNGRGTLYCDSAPAGTATPTITGTPPTATFTRTATPTFTITPIQCNGWVYTGESQYNLASGGYYKGSSSTVSEVTTQYHSSNHSMQVHFVWADGWYEGMGWNWANWNTSSSNIYNASSATALDMWIRSDSGTITTLYLSLNDSAGGGTNSVPITDYLAGGVTTAWQELKIPLSVFTGADMSLLWGLNIFTGGSQSGDQTFYVDDISFLLPCGTPTSTRTQVQSTSTRTVLPTATYTRSVSATVSVSPSNSPTRTWTAPASPTMSFTATRTGTPTAAYSPVFSRTSTSTYTATGTFISTPTFTPTPSRTRSATASVSPSNTDTRTPTYTRTVTPTVTNSPNYSPTDSATATSSASASVSPTIIITNTPTSSVQPTSSVSPTVTLTGTVTQAGTMLSSPTQTCTRTFAATPPVSMTITATQSVTAATQNPTQTVSISATNTGTQVPSATRTMTLSMAPSSTPSPTATADASAGVSPSMTFTVTRTFTPTMLPSAANTLTVTRTSTHTITLTATMTRTPLPATLTMTPTAAIGGKFEIKDPLLAPNPLNPGRYELGIRVNLTRQAVKLSARIYTVSFRRVFEETWEINAYGEITLNLAGYKLNGLAGGTYYVVMTGESASGEKAVSKPEELLILR